MRTIKVKFLGFWGNFKETDNFIYDALSKRYNVELSDDPQYLFYAGYNCDIFKYDCIRISYSFENFIPDFNLCDYAMGFAYIDFEDRYLRYPLYLNGSFDYYPDDDYALDMQNALNKHHFDEEDLAKKEGFCSMVVSSGVDKIRNDFFERLSEYKTVASGGRYKNNVGGPVRNKRDFQRKYKFSICFENSSSSGYTTEKLMQAFGNKTVPIYFGSKRINEEFNPKAFINCADYNSVDEVISRIRQIDSDDELYLQMMREPAFNEGFSLEEKEMEFESFLFHIIDQDYNKAFRRNRSDYGRKYEKKARISNKYYNYLLQINNVVHRIKRR